jgi:hypothetical protein
MPNFDSTISRCYNQAIGVRLSASARVVDNGINATLYANNINVIWYMLRNMAAGTYHSFNGSMSISAYNSQVSARALYSVRVSPTEINPLHLPGRHSIQDAVGVHADAVVTDKTKFLVWVYILQNLDTPTVVHGRSANRIEVARLVLGLFDVLKNGDLLPEGLVAPCSIEVVTVETRVANRPGVASNTEEVRLNAGFPIVDLRAIGTHVLVGGDPLQL